MKFELKTYNRNVSDDDIVNDIKNVARILGKKSFTMASYKKYGAYDPSLLRKRYGTWKNALNSADLDYSRNRYSDAELLSDIKNIADDLELKTISKEEYNSNGKFSADTIADRFGSWKKALSTAGLDIYKDKNISEKLLMQNIAEVYIKLGKQPTFKQMRKPLSEYSTSPYIDRYGTWQKALEVFSKWVESDNMYSDSVVSGSAQGKPKKDASGNAKSRSTGDGSTMH